MINRDIQIELIMISSYCDIIMQIIKNHKELSINKTVTFSYLNKKDKYYYEEIYCGRNKKNIVLKYLSQLSGYFGDYIENIPYIIKSIHVLASNNLLIVENDNLKIGIMTDDYKIRRESLFLWNVIEESKNMTERQFLKEVINNV